MINDIQKSAENKMHRSLEVLKENLTKVRTGRAHTGLLDQVTVEYWGSEVPVSQVGNVTLLDARTIGVKPFESNMAAKIEKAIRDSNLGLNPSSVGDLIRVPMPMLTEERRKDLIKVVRHEAEDGRVSIRNVRRDANDQIKKLLKDKAISEDDARRGEENIQNHVFTYNRFIKINPNNLVMPRRSRAYRPIIGVLGVPARIPAYACFHTLELPKNSVNTPKTTAANNKAFHKTSPTDRCTFLYSVAVSTIIPRPT